MEITKEQVKKLRNMTGNMIDASDCLLALRIAVGTQGKDTVENETYYLALGILRLWNNTDKFQMCYQLTLAQQEIKDMKKRIESLENKQ